MSITLAKTAGFCFGVDRGVTLVYRLLSEGKRVCTLGPIIHNPQVVEDFKKRGVRIVSAPEEVMPDEVMVIRSHGVAADVYKKADALGVKYEDATCPFVAKIHRIVAGCKSDELVFLAGDPDHPEVKGICGHAVCPTIVFRTPEELIQIDKAHPEYRKKPVTFAAQTTFQADLWQECARTAKKVYTNPKIFDTICNATDERQSEAKEIASRSDFMIVIGGRHSSNTKKLSEVCSAHCPTLLIETAKELPESMLLASSHIGVTAGASTPAYIIKEVFKTMSEMLENQGVVNEEAGKEDFAELLEQSLNEKLYTGKRVKGVVTSIQPNEVLVDVGAKQAGFVALSELTDDPSLKAEDVVKVGDEINLAVIKVNDQEGTVMLSKKRCDAEEGFEEIVKAHEEGTVLTGTVVDVVRGGVLVLTNNVRVFVPASQASGSRVEDLSTLLKKEVRYKIIEVNENRRRAVGSVRAVIREERAAKQAAFWESVEVGQVFHGEVKSLTSYGAFVDLGAVDGMIHITELSWKRIKHPSEVVKVGDMVEVYVKDIDKEAKKISLGYKKSEDNPWNIFLSKCHIGDVITAKIASLTPFGAFAEIIPGVDGLIHISQISTERVEKAGDVLSVGQEVNVKITDIDVERKRISLSIRALLEEAAAAKAEAAAAEPEDTVYYSTEDPKPEAEPEEPSAE